MLTATLPTPRTAHTTLTAALSALRLQRGPLPTHPQATLLQDGPDVYALLSAQAAATVLSATGLRAARRAAFLSLCRALRAAARPARAVLDLMDFDMDITYLGDMHGSLPDEDDPSDLVRHAPNLRDLQRAVTTPFSGTLTPPEQRAQQLIAALAAHTQNLHPDQNTPPPGMDFSEWQVPHVLLCPARDQAEHHLVRELHAEAEQHHHMMGEDPRPHATFLLTSPRDRARYVRLTRREPLIERAFQAAVSALQQLMTPEALELTS